MNIKNIILDDKSKIGATAYGLVHGKDVPNEDVVAMAEEVACAIQAETDADGFQDNWAVACTAVLTIFGIDPETLVQKKLDQTSEIESLKTEVHQLRAAVAELAACAKEHKTIRFPPT